MPFLSLGIAEGIYLADKDGTTTPDQSCCRRRVSNTPQRREESKKGASDV